MTILLDHVNIRCSDLDTTRKFFEDIVGLTVGDRPDFPFPGYWLYAADKAVVHLVEMALSGEPGGKGSMDHFALRGGDYAVQTAAIRAAGLSSREVGVPGMNLKQVFVQGPDDIVVELQCET